MEKRQRVDDYTAQIRHVHRANVRAPAIKTYISIVPHDKNLAGGNSQWTKIIHFRRSVAGVDDVGFVKRFAID